MTTIAQTGHTFAAELKSLGIVIPDNTTSIHIKAYGPDEPVVILFECCSLNSIFVTKTKISPLIDKNDNPITASRLYEVIRDAACLPKETIAFEIVANSNDVVKVNIEAALPLSSLSGLKDILA